MSRLKRRGPAAEGIDGGRDDCTVEAAVLLGIGGRVGEYSHVAVIVAAGPMMNVGLAAAALVAQRFADGDVLDVLHRAVAPSLLCFAVNAVRVEAIAGILEARS